MIRTECNCSLSCCIHLYLLRVSLTTLAMPKQSGDRMEPLCSGQSVIFFLIRDKPSQVRETTLRVRVSVLENAIHSAEDCSNDTPWITLIKNKIK